MNIHLDTAKELFASLREQRALLGGTFNPVHVGHIQLATRLVQLFDFKEIVFLPASTPAHKKKEGILPFEWRCALLQLAIDGIKEQNFKDKIDLSDFEKSFEGRPSYTWDVLEAWQKSLGKSSPPSRPLFILGMEDLALLPTWKNGLDLPLLTDFLIIPRGEQDYRHFAEIVYNFWQVQAKSLGHLLHFDTISQAKKALSSKDQEIWLAELPPEKFTAEKLTKSNASSAKLLYAPLPYLPISATHIRELFLQEKGLQDFVPEGCLPFLEAKRGEILRFWGNRV